MEREQTTFNWRITAEAEAKQKQLMSNGTNTNWFVRTIEGQNGTYIARAPGMYAGGADAAAGVFPSLYHRIRRLV